jgi:hypothetical protein
MDRKIFCVYKVSSGCNCEKVGNIRDYFSLIFSSVKIQTRDLLNPNQEGYVTQYEVSC